MPLIGRSFAAKVWIENGDIILMVYRRHNLEIKNTEDGAGLIRLRLNSNQAVTYTKQTLGFRWWPEILIEGKINGDRPFTIAISGSLRQPLIQIAISSPLVEVEVVVKYETWLRGELKPIEGGFMWIHPVSYGDVGNRVVKGVDALLESPHAIVPFTHGGCIRSIALSKAHPAYDKVKVRMPELVPLGSTVGKFKGMGTKVIAAKSKLNTTHLELALTLNESSSQSRFDFNSVLSADAAQNADMFCFNQERVASEALWTTYWAQKRIYIHRNCKIPLQQDYAWHIGRAYQLMRYHQAMDGENLRDDSSQMNAVKIGTTNQAVDFIRSAFAQAHRKPFEVFTQPNSTMRMLEEMLVCAQGDRILIGRAWPAEWECDFKLSAMGEATVEGRVVDGTIFVDRVTPDSRQKDIEVFKLIKINNAIPHPE